MTHVLQPKTSIDVDDLFVGIGDGDGLREVLTR
jgi:hypothetical protein